jgi:CHAD domain-containing protein
MLPGVDEGDIRAIHRTRVASRRLRELVPVLQLDVDLADRLRRRLRKLTRRLGRVRELDVLGLLVAELEKSGEYPSSALERIKDDVAAEDRACRDGMASAAVGEDLRKLARKLEQVVERLRRAADTPAQQRAVRWAIDARVAQRATALKDAIERAGNVYLPDRLHVVRIALKKLRYGVELAEDVTRQPESANRRLLKREQEVLGRMHDLQVLMDRVRRVQGSLTPPDLVAWRELDVLVRGLETSCRRLHARYMHDRPTLVQLCDRLRSSAAPERRARSRTAG